MNKVNLIVACDNKFGIGITDQLNGYIPWILKNDLKFFKQTTLNKTILMGRKTWNSLPIKPLKHRQNIIISSNLDLNLPYTNVIKSFKELDLNNDVFVIGGSEVYKYFLENDLVQTIYMTHVEGDFKCNTFFPKESFENFINYNYIVRTLIEEGVENDIKYRIMKYEIDNNVFNKDESNYLGLINDILLNGDKREGRNGITYSLFGKQLEFNLLNNVLPLLTTRKIFLRGIFEELSFFIRGQTDSKLLEQKGVNIWKGNTSREFLDSRKLNHYREGDMGPMYGFNWRHYGSEYEGCDSNYYGKGYDQLYNLIKGLVEDPYSRRHLLTTYDPSAVNRSVLAPCHGIVVQFNVTSDNYLDCMMYQRSADIGLGVPFNITSYALMTYMIGNVTGYTPRRLIMSFGDIHVYESHANVLREQMKREMYSFPFIKMKRKFEGVTVEERIKYMEEIGLEDIEIVKYRSHSAMKMDMVV
jgi:dihydrofolate reductase/thymidylate synthase